MKSAALEPDWYALKQVAAKWAVSYDTIYNLVITDSIPCAKIGGAYRVPRKYVDSLPDVVIKKFNGGSAL